MLKHNNLLSTQQLIEKLKNIELLCLDADGTMTDGGMYLDDKGTSFKKFFAHDGIGISMVKNIGVKVAMITTSVTPVMQERAKILKLDALVTGSFNKGEAVEKLCKDFGVSTNNTAHIGDDINDIMAFNKVGMPIAVANSVETIFNFVCYITNKQGGHGAVREICDLIMIAKTGKAFGKPYVFDINQ